MKPIIRSILDTDLYKLTMQQAVIQHFPRLKVRYKFIDRNKTIYPDGFDKVIKEQVKQEWLDLMFGEWKPIDRQACDEGDGNSFAKFI